MATYTSNYGWTKPSGNDNVDISVLNANLDSQDSIMHDAFANMAQAFSESSTYEVGDIVVYGTTTYKCHTAVTTPGSWTGSTNWQVYKLSEGGGGTSDYPDLTNKPSINGVTLSGNKTASDLGLQDKMQYSTMPTASADNEGKIYQYVGTADANYTNGYYYKCVENSGSYSWQLVENIKEQTPTFSQASTRNNIASGDKLSVILGKIQKFFNDLKTVAFSGSYTDLINTPTIPAAQVNSDWNASSGVAEILNKPSSYKPSSHLHGNIQNNGTLQTTDIAVANGDKLVVTDSSNSAKIARTSVAFDGTTTTQALSKKGTFETFSKFSGSYADLTNKPSLATVATSGSYADLSNKPTIPTSAGDITYDNTDSGLSATNVQGAVDELAESYPADKVMMSDGVTSVEEAVDKVKGDLSIINSSNYIDPMSTKTFIVKKMYCHMLFSTRTNSVSMIAYGNLVDMVNNSNLTVTVIDVADRNVISITNNNNLSTNIVLI